MSASAEAVPGTTARVVLTADLHARPAGQLARVVAAYSAAVQLTVDDRTADCRSVLAVMGLGATTGETVTVWAQGSDAVEVVVAVVEVLSSASGKTELAP
jgi:phosphotransferase system HPr (HPr) family protein